MAASTNQTESTPRSALADAVQEHLFSDPDVSVYAVIDGASCPDLRMKLWELTPEHACLYSGDLEPDMAEVAPYLVRVERDSPFLRWLLEEGWGNHWGIFATANEDLRTMRKHFRTFLMVYSPEGKQLYFRYYDPRVLRIYLPTCNRAELIQLFGPISSYFAESEDSCKWIRFSQGAEVVVQDEVSVDGLASGKSVT